MTTQLQLINIIIIIIIITVHRNFQLQVINVVKLPEVSSRYEERYSSTMHQAKSRKFNTKHISILIRPTVSFLTAFYPSK